MKKFIFSVYTIAILGVVPATIYGYLHENKKPDAQTSQAKESEASLSSTEADMEVSINLLSVVRGI